MRRMAELLHSDHHMMDHDARIDRAVVLAGLWAATRGSQAERVRLTVTCAAAGARQANAGKSLAALLAEIDDLESTILGKIAESVGGTTADSPTTALDGVRRTHDCCSRMRAAAIAGFGHAAASEARRRARAARHDIVNNIGTVRNAILLMDDEPDAAAREHFRAIAKRNSVTSEHLVRSHLSDEAACQGALAASTSDAEALIASELNTCPDRECRAETVAALQALATLTGVCISTDALRLARNASASLRGNHGNQRNDFRGAGESDNTDAVGF